MTPQGLDALLRALPGVTMEVLWGADNVYKVGGKMFACLGPGGGVSFKATDIAFEVLTETGQARPAPYLARAKWVSLNDLGDMADEDLAEHLKTAHGLVAAKLTRAARRELGV